MTTPSPLARDGPGADQTGEIYHSKAWKMEGTWNLNECREKVGRSPDGKRKRDANDESAFPSVVNPWRVLSPKPQRGGSPERLLREGATPTIPAVAEKNFTNSILCDFDLCSTTLQLMSCARFGTKLARHKSSSTNATRHVQHKKTRRFGHSARAVSAWTESNVSRPAEPGGIA